MSKELKDKDIPMLRFPSFKDAGKWEEKTLEEVALFLKGKGISKSDVTAGGKQPCIRYAELYTHYDEIINSIISFTNLPSQDLILSEANDVIIPSSGETREDMATASCVMIAGVALGGDLNILRSEINGVFLAYYLTHAKKGAIAKLSQGDAVVHLYSSQLKKLIINFPKLKAEQKKIADCLSSLDELIASQNHKLDALKSHKKGLMQQLFPAEGETVPKLRFKEFRNSGEWIVQEFSEYIVLYRGSSPRPIQNYLTKDNSGVNWIKIGDTKSASNFIISHVEERITPEGAEKSRKVNAGELILANSMSFGKTYQLAIDGCIYDGWFVLREYEQFFDKQFLHQLLNSDYMQNQYKKFSAGGIVQNISSDIVYRTLLPHTSLGEQQQIASCLSSLDQCIIAQNEKVVALKEHKKGLMRQLFPEVEE